jgi:hypothetical protein
MRTWVLVLVLVFCLSLAGAALAADIVTMPTANQLKAGEVELADYYLFLDFDQPMPQFARVQTLYVGITDKLELDAHRYDLDKVRPETVWIASYKLMSQSATDPVDLVFGIRDLADRVAQPALPKKTSYYVSAARTMNPPAPGAAPVFPIVRLHLSVGTEDPSLLGEDRHEGLFGGAQVLVTPKVGLVALWDGQDFISGITYTHAPNWPTIKGGTFGDHKWVGIAYTWNKK